MTDEAMTPLRQRMIEDMRMRRLAPKTQKDYIQVIKNLAVFIGRSPDTASFEDIRRFQLQVAAGGVGAGAINRNVSARTAAAPIGGGSRNGNIRLFHSLDGAISQKLAQVVEDLGGAVRLVAAAPFGTGDRRSTTSVPRSACGRYLFMPMLAAVLNRTTRRGRSSALTKVRSS